jgi:hypothetical protein
MGSATYGLELLDRLRSLSLPSNDYAVFGSGPLLIRGIVDAVGDLDVLCRGEAWLAARRAATSQRVEEGVTVVTFGPLTFGTSWGLGEFDVDVLIDNAETIDDLRFVQLEHVVAYKRAAGRPKDLAHLELIEAWIASR